MRIPLLLSLIAALLVCSYAPEAVAGDGETLKIGTLVPKHSSWGKVFRVWSLAVKKKTDGRLRLKFYWNGSQGNEATMVGKVRAGQLDGAALGAAGLGHIHKPIMALQLPGLFREWQDIDRAQKAVLAEFQQACEKKGFYLSTIGAVGRARAMSSGRAIRTPEDLKGMKPVGIRSDLVGPTFSSVLGTTRVPLSVPEILPALSQGRVNFLVAPPLITEQLQWAPHLDHVTDEVLGIGIGAMVLSKPRLDGLEHGLVQVLKKTGDKAGKMLRKRIRRHDDAAYERIKRRMTVVQLSDAQRDRWEGIFAQIRNRLAQGTFPEPLVRRLEKVAGK
ncbi:MAG: TRAP transporter substrate-binding protein DctP [Deltaproteobacteria bacterium]|nr:TRAP transporter substrate-binding protein DctP [Deltaproteobacteria bacterium]MBW2530266.1 TRAP transporter substrate-binding protein DctP [Deltaproteobacteria bacterium]